MNQKIIGQPTPRSTHFEDIIKFLFALYAITHMYVAWRLPFSLDELKVIHIGFASVLLFFLPPLKISHKSAGWFGFGAPWVFCL